MAAVSRRAVVRAALGSWLATHSRFRGGARMSPRPQSATPSAGQTAELRPGSSYLRASRSRATLRPLHRRRREAAALRLVRPGESLGNFNPSAFRQDPQIPLSYLEPLVRPDPATMRPTPWLAEHWEWRADGLELVFLLRDDVLWHAELPLTAADAAFTFEVYRSDTESAVSGLFALVESLDAVSERELRVRFTARDANWLFNVATPANHLERTVRRVLAAAAGVWANAVGIRLVRRAADWYRAMADYRMGRQPKSSSPGSTGTGEGRRGSTSSRSRRLTVRAPDWKPGKTETRRCSGRCAFARYRNGLTQRARSIPCRPHRSCSPRSTSPIRTNRRGACGQIFASGWRRRRQSTRTLRRQKSSADSRVGSAAGTVAQPWAHDDERRHRHTVRRPPRSC